MPIPEGYGTFAWRGHSRSPLSLPPVKPHHGGAIERLQRGSHTKRGEVRRLVPNFEASSHEGFPRDSRKTRTPSAALAAPHRRYGARPRGPVSLPRLGRCLCPPGSGGGGGGFLPPLRETRLLEEAVAEEGATNRLSRRNPRASAQTGPPGESPGSLRSPTRRGISLPRPSAPF